MDDCFVFYDSDKNIKVISSDIASYKHYDHFKIDYNLALDFLSGKKLIEHYYVKHNSLNIFSLEKKHIVTYTNVYSDFIKAEKNNSDANLIIKFDNLLNQYTLALVDVIKGSIDQSEYNKILKFYVVKSDQINWILNSFDIKLQDLINENQVIKFNSTYESSLDNIEIITRRYFDTIGITQ